MRTNDESWVPTTDDGVRLWVGGQRLVGAWVDQVATEHSGEIELQAGKGCRQCRNTGFSGRCGIFEIFPVSDEINRMICNEASEADIRKQAVKEGMTSLKEDAWRKVLDGITTYEEAARVTGLG